MNRKQHLTAALTLSAILVGTGISSVQHSNTLVQQAKILSPLVQEKLRLEHQLEHNTYTPADIPPLSNAIAEIPTNPDYAQQARMFQELKHKSSHYLVIGIAGGFVGAFIMGLAVAYERKQ